MYYLIMNNVVENDSRFKISCTNKKYTPLREKEVSFINFKFYQKFFVLLISFFLILIFSESPRELENICESYNSRKICNVW